MLNVQSEQVRSTMIQHNGVSMEIAFIKTIPFQSGIASITDLHITIQDKQHDRASLSFFLPLLEIQDRFILRDIFQDVAKTLVEGLYVDPEADDDKGGSYA